MKLEYIYEEITSTAKNNNCLVEINCRCFSIKNIHNGLYIQPAVVSIAKGNESSDTAIGYRPCSTCLESTCSETDDKGKVTTTIICSCVCVMLVLMVRSSNLRIEKRRAKDAWVMQEWWSTFFFSDKHGVGKTKQTYAFIWKKKMLVILKIIFHFNFGYFGVVHSFCKK